MERTWNGAETYQNALDSKLEGFQHEIGFCKSLRAGHEGVPLFGGKTMIFMYPACPAPSKHLQPMALHWSEMSQMKWDGNYHQTMCFALFLVRISSAQLPEVVGHWGGDA